jgi:hypothetical protein
MHMILLLQRDSLQLKELNGGGNAVPNSENIILWTKLNLGWRRNVWLAGLSFCTNSPKTSIQTSCHIPQY